jgi:alpha-galactosidase
MNYVEAKVGFLSSVLSAGLSLTWPHKSNFMHFRQAILQLDNKTYSLTPGRANSFDEIHVDFQVEPFNPTPDPSPIGRGDVERFRQVGTPLSFGGGVGGGVDTRYSIFLHPKQDVTIQRLEIQFDLQLPPDAHFFANGFQSWSESRLMRLNEAIPHLHFFAKKYLGFYGDEHIPDIPHGRSYLHSWTYTTIHGSRYTADGWDKILFTGSLNETTGFTLFLYDQPNGVLTVRKDMDGLQLSHSFPALDFGVWEGDEEEVFEKYFQALGTPPPATAPAIGWASWYNHFNKISEEILLQNLENVAASGLPFQYFQIDDGWQTAVGDWLSVKPAFPHGMGFLAEKIKERGLSPGLWLAPFVATEDSDLAKKHPDWLLKDAKGKPLKVGWNPMWGSWYCALDFYNNEVRNYLGGVFHAVLDRWGFKLVKLDFLFAVCLAPPLGKTRGQVMHEAMEFLRKLVGTKKILACGVPLGSAFGLADYCRIGGDIHLSWEHRFLTFLRFRERVNTLTSLRSTLGRWQLNGRAFHNDPDVFVLRNENQKLSLAQQQTVLTINVLLGNLLFTSDDLGKYSPEQTAELEAALELRGSRILAVLELEKDVYKIDFENSGEACSAFCNLTKRKRFIETKNGQIELQPFETLILTL